VAANVTCIPKFRIESEDDFLEVYKDESMICIYSNAGGVTVELTVEEAEAVCSCIMALVSDE
jgi:hypothetical protein